MDGKIKSVLINGYTDNTGTRENNYNLSQKRAKATQEIVSKIMTDTSILARGLGVCESRQDGKARRSDLYLILR